MFGPYGRVWIRPLRTTNGTQQNRGAFFTTGDRIRRQWIAVRVDCRTADHVLIADKTVSVRLRDPLQNLAARGDNFRADAIARQ